MNLTVNFQPCVSGSVRSDLAGRFFIAADADLAARCEQLRGQIEQGSDAEQVAIDEQSIDLQKIISKLWVFAEETPIRLQADFRQASLEGIARVSLSAGDLTPAQQRLLNSIGTSIRALAWQHLRESLGMARASNRLKVFISYRSGHERLAEAIAVRLGREGLDPWFDKWEVLAGDSLPGSIERGFAESVAFIALITSDYREGRWATEEMEIAITRRVEEAYPVIPVLAHDCPKPHLLRHLVHVDLREQNPEAFEEKMGEVIDAINRLDRNPFRQ